MEPIIHYVFPVLIAMAAGITEKEALLIGLVALAPDLDVFFFAHRTITHSIFIPAAAYLASFASKNQNTRRALSLAAFFLVAHVALDFFDSPVELLQPFSSTAYGLDVRLNIIKDTLAPDFSVKIEAGTLSPSKVAELVTPAGVAFGIFFIALLASKHLQRNGPALKARKK